MKKKERGYGGGKGRGSGGRGRGGGRGGRGGGKRGCGGGGRGRDVGHNGQGGLIGTIMISFNSCNFTNNYY